MRKIAGLAAAIAIIGSVTVAAVPASAASTVQGGGSSFAGNILVPCANSFTGATVTYVPSSSGTGRTNFANGSFAYAATDAPYGSADAQPKTPFTYIPLVGGPIAIPFNLGNIPGLNLTPKVLGNIFRGTITKWNDPAIAKLNKGRKLPAQTINVIYRSTKSGTSQNFATYLRDNGAAGWVADGTWATATGKATPVGTGAATSSALVGLVKSTAYSIGYADLTDVAKKDLHFAAIQNGYGKFIKPNANSASLFLAAQTIDKKTGLVNLNFKGKFKGAYNLSIVTYLIGSTASADASTGAAVKGFANYVLKTCAPAQAANLGYVALKGKILQSALALAAKLN